MVNHKLAAILALTTLFLGPASQVFGASPKVIWAKSGTLGPTMQTELAGCIKESLTINLTAQSDIPVGPLGMIVGDVVASVTQFPKERAEYVKRCMLGRGYHAVRLSPSEEADFDRQPTDATSAWVDRFYSQADFAQRLAAAAPPLLEESNNEALTYGSVRFDPVALTSASGLVRAGGVVLSGTISHRGTGHVLADAEISFDGYYDYVLAGTVLHEAVFPDESGSNKTYWCGPYVQAGFIFDACIRNAQDGYVLVHPEGARWITTGLDTHGATGSADHDAFSVDYSPNDLLGPVGFAIAARKISETAVVLEAVVNQGRDFETLWKATLPFDSNGVAVLPFWTHRLVITRVGEGITAAFSADGDGAGWPYRPVDV